MKEVLQEVRELVAAADLAGALEVLNNLVAHADVDKPLLDKEHWKHLSWPVRRRKALALVGGGDQEREAPCSADGVAAKKPGVLDTLPLPQLGRTQRCPEKGVSPTRSGRAGAASSGPCATSSTMASSAIASCAKVTTKSSTASNATASSAMPSIAMASGVMARTTTTMARATTARAATATLMLGTCPAVEEETRQCRWSPSRRRRMEAEQADSFEHIDDMFYPCHVQSRRLPSERRELLGSEAPRQHKSVA
eukprot:TRINITY_DN14425_c0_g1_i5.p1 TRINITY_DN14425_c0_g1~~TRINITY_DN14425_c0_g1_i5.p1  ORF type:complete len:252 (+),score=40.85 TRINITY_DN14425_c0_g1_i5:358-1113(+)